jgi:hypothetical protein
MSISRPTKRSSRLVGVRNVVVHSFGVLYGVLRGCGALVWCIAPAYRMVFWKCIELWCNIDIGLVYGVL